MKSNCSRQPLENVNTETEESLYTIYLSRIYLKTTAEIFNQIDGFYVFCAFISFPIKH